MWVLGAATAGAGVALWAAVGRKWVLLAAQVVAMMALRRGVRRRLRPLVQILQAHAARGIAKCRAQPGSAAAVPFVAAFVGWFTNWLAVQMIFYPLKFWGLPLKQYVISSVYGCEVLNPLGWLGWQGIVPAKTAQMAYDMVEMVTTKLISVPEVFGRLEPATVASLLTPQVPPLALDVGRDLMQENGTPWAVDLAEARAIPRLPGDIVALLDKLQRDYVSGFVRALQANTDRVMDIKELVVTRMNADKRILVDMFQRVGKDELRFLVNSGLWFGFLLGLLQLAVWMFYDSPWTLTVGGSLVGYATNWIALKCIFEPVEPVSWGPFTFQGLFPARQKEVSKDFSEFLSSEVLTSENIWDNMLHGSRSSGFREVLSEHTQTFAEGTAGALDVRFQGAVEPEVIKGLCDKVSSSMAERLEKYVHPMHGYADATLGLQENIELELARMPAKEFERVLHPIFEEDEMTLILAGAVLGAIAGAVQQAIAVYQERKKKGSGGGEQDRP